jgi:class 3 adenylate cyclase/predicted metal-dependent HD superfamily phosphohydrolase
MAIVQNIKIMFKKICVLLVFLQLISLIRAQEYGLPMIHNFAPKDYRHENQNFSIAQDNYSIIYVGNANGIMAFDNSTWNLIKVSGRPIIRINEKNEKFYAGYNQAGKIVYKNGKMSLEPFRIFEEYKPGHFTNIISLNDELFLTSSHQLFALKKDSLDIEISNAPGIKIFKIHKKLLIYVPQRGLYYWNKNKIKEFENSNLFENLPILDIIDIPNTKNDLIVLVDDDQILYKYKNKNLVPINNNIQDFIKSNIYTCSIILDDGRLIIGTMHGGIVCIDKNGELLFSINRESGLRDNYITDMIIDNYGRLWVSTYNGISVLEINSDLSFFSSSFGFTGTVLSVIRFNGQLYIATVNGVFVYNSSNIYDSARKIFDIRKRFEKIEDIRSICWKLTEINNHLFALTTDGLYEITGKKATLKIKGSFNCYSSMSYHPSKYLFGTSEGILMAKITKNSIDTIGYVKDFKYSIRTIAEDYFGNFWLGTNEDGLFQTAFHNGLKKDTKIYHFTSEQGLPADFEWIDVYPSFQGILFSTDKGVYRYNYSKNKFDKDTLLGYDFSNNKKYLYPIIEDSKKNIWYSCITKEEFERETGYFIFNGANKKYTPNYKKFALLQEYVIECIYPESPEKVWLGASDGLILYSPLKKGFDTLKFDCFIRNIQIGTDTTIYFAPGDNLSDHNISFHFNKKRIRFNFSAPKFDMLNNTKYQVKLDGFDKNWSEWTDKNFKEYTSLYEGKYTFRVRAMDSFGNISNEASLTFEITPPFYRTWLAFVIYAIILSAIVFVIVILVKFNYKREENNLKRRIEEKTNELARQKEQIEQLVAKLMPQSAVNEIRDQGKAKTHRYEMVTVLFADIQGFSKFAESTKPEEIIKYLNVIFNSFDNIIAKYNIEKIKTIGDAYMCAGGMPKEDNINPIQVVLAALEMQREIQRLNDTRDIKLEIRIGIHTGPVVAGVIGIKKLEYDIWGDTVNIASRMESYGMINKVNISEQTYNHVKDFFVCQYRGKIEIKYKGEMEMYFVHEIKKALSVDGDRKTPNKNFFVKLQHVQFKNIQEKILEKLQKSLPLNLYYHNVKHTIDMLYIVEKIGREEGVDEEEMLLLKCAALFHDAGFISQYDNNEEIGASMAEAELKNHGFTDEQIETVKRLIMATKMPHKPKDLLEKIMCDADLDYLGRPDFIPISQNLFRELFERGKISTIEQWNKLQYRFIEKHKYFTATARKERDPGKQVVLKQLKEMFE